MGQQGLACGWSVYGIRVKALNLDRLTWMKVNLMDNKNSKRSNAMLLI